MNVGVRLPGFESWLYLLLAVQTRESDLPSLCLSVLICKNENGNSTYVIGFCEDDVSYHVKSA